jgi:hypothetical protein
MLENPPPHSSLAAAFCNPTIYSSRQIYVAGIYSDMIFRLMSDYEVTLVNDNSKSTPLASIYLNPLTLGHSVCIYYTLQQYAWTLEIPTLVNRQEFYVRFKGPEESMFCRTEPALHHANYSSTIYRRSLEDPRRAARSVPIQESQYWIRQPNLPPEHR